MQYRNDREIEMSNFADERDATCAVPPELFHRRFFIDAFSSTLFHRRLASLWQFYRALPMKASAAVAGRSGPQSFSAL